jgi:transcription elongation factor Elf1
MGKVNIHKKTKSKKPSIIYNEITCPHCNAKFTWAIIKTKNRVYAGPYYKPKAELTDATFPGGH